VRQPFNLALRVERIGLVPLRYPILFLILVGLCCAVGALGLTRLKVDDSLSQLFQSDSPDYKQFESLAREFPSAEYDVLIVLDGPSLLARDTLGKTRELVTDLQLVHGVRGIISLFSARRPPQGGHLPPALFPPELPEGQDYDKLIAEVRQNEILRGKLLSEDGQLALVVLALDPEAVQQGSLAEVVGEIRSLVAEHLAGADVVAQLSGVPVMQLEIRNAVERDSLIYNAAGLLAGCLIAILFFRRISFMVIAAAPPLIAILISLGCLGWLSFRLNMFLNVMTPLIMVLSFSDSMQLTFAARDRLIAGEDRVTAFRHAILVVGPACVLTHATAAVSFISLRMSDSGLIRAFGEAGLLATATALLTVLLLVPTLGVLLVRRTDTVAPPGGDLGVVALRRFCAWIAARMVGHPGLYSLLGLLAVVVLSVVYAGLEPRYRLADQVPDKRQAIEASGRLDAKKMGASPIDVLITLPAGASLYDPETLAIIAEVHRAAEAQAGLGNVWSVETLRRWLSEKAQDPSVETLQRYVGLLPAHLTRRFIAEDQHSVLVSARIPDADASRLLPIVDGLDAALKPVRAEHPRYTVAVTGLAAIAARNSANMIGKLNAGLTIEIVFIAAFIGLAFRSFAVMVISILPGIFPIVASGALLRLFGDGLQFASVVALTVAFGLSLSATIHFLNRLRLESHDDDAPARAVERATVLVGPALILTSFVLASGLAVTVFSDLPSLRLFGWLSAFSMLAALAADLLILRPTAVFTLDLVRRLKARPG
jgi:predicted RND superfamily exporter protein